MNNNYSAAHRHKQWFILKTKLHQHQKHRTFSKGEVWWCAVGENIGVEINGKGPNFSRPVLILHKLNQYSFLAVPLTSKNHQGSWYATFQLQGKKQTAVLSQIRVVSTARLYQRIGKLDDNDIKIVYTAFRNLY